MAKSILKKKVSNSLSLSIISLGVAIFLIAFCIGLYNGMTIKEIVAVDIPIIPPNFGPPKISWADPCGLANGVATATTPTASNLCWKTGRASAVSIIGANKDTWSWTCTVYITDVEQRFRSQFAGKNSWKVSCSAPKIIVAKEAPLPAPTASLTVEGAHSHTYTAGQKDNIVWSSTNADTFSSIVVTKCPNLGVNTTTTWVSGNTANGSVSDQMLPSYVGCTWTITYKATNSKTGKYATDTITMNEVAAQ